MTQQQFVLTSRDLDVALRTIAEPDCENLRQWKNANRFSFFFQGIITPAQQAEWFRDYMERPNDFMFIVQSDEQTVGCMGFRVLDGHSDVYNVILANPQMGGKGLMGKAMRLMCSFMVAHFPPVVGARVLQSNPAIRWYRKNGFHEIAAHDTFVEMKLDMLLFQPCAFEQVP